MADPNSIQEIPDSIRPEALVALCRRSPHLLAEFRRSGETELAAAVEAGDLVRLRAAMMRRVMLRSAPAVPPAAGTSTVSPALFPPIGLIDEIPSTLRPEQLIELCAQQPHLLQQFLSRDPQQGELIRDRDLTRLRTLIMQRALKVSKRHYDDANELELLQSDPTNQEYQRRLEERLRLQQVEENRILAFETFPEAFTSVSMLYVYIEINGQPVKALVDSGAQSTIMSEECAERCGLMRLLDRRAAGQAQGIGTANILGRVYLTQMKFGGSYFPVSITVLEQRRVEFLLGLDMLRSYRANIDLQANVLRFQLDAGYEEVPFLGESESPTELFRSNSQETSAAAASKSEDPSSDDGQKLLELMALGFSEVEARRALLAANGDVEMAASFLLTDSKPK